MMSPCHSHLANGVISIFDFLLILLSLRVLICGEKRRRKKLLNANEQLCLSLSLSLSLALIVKWLTFAPQIRAGFSAPLVEMLMVPPTQFNVNPILLFSPVKGGAPCLYFHTQQQEGQTAGLLSHLDLGNQPKTERDGGTRGGSSGSWGSVLGMNADFNNLILPLQKSALL